MVCSSGIGFNPVIDGTRYTYDVYGLYNGLFVMRDRQTGSVWTHYDGTVLTGPLMNSGVNLEFAPLVHTTWAEWTTQYPQTLVLDWYPEFAGNYRDVKPGAGGLGPEFQRTLLHWDDRLPENEMILGVGIGETFKAYVLADFADGMTVLPDTIADVPVVLFIDGRSLYGLAFVPEVNGEMVEITAINDRITDNHGNTWDLTGKAINGLDKGAQLPFVTSFITEWYGWAAYHPETAVYVK
ncbi:MAG: DUF3179 domain-containing protein [Anaerolineales bacterium]|nr:DUF3179 domain-containing protein [Anaerolineales bacterium]MCA9929981.1 DUF3179 domain-containing protein [Anaerolineales bacterium]